jgi:hypothetical protein
MNMGRDNSIHNKNYFCIKKIINNFKYFFNPLLYHKYVKIKNKEYELSVERSGNSHERVNVMEYHLCKVNYLVFPLYYKVYIASW